VPFHRWLTASDAATRHRESRRQQIKAHETSHEFSSRRPWLTRFIGSPREPTFFRRMLPWRGLETLHPPNFFPSQLGLADST